jgi:hypothetical protein
LSVGLFASALFKRTAAATVVAYLAVFAIGIGTLIPTLMNNETVLSYMSNPDVMASLDTKTLLSSIPPVLFTIPGVGLLSLLADQTGLLQNTFSRIPSGYAYYQVFGKVDFGLVAWINMGAMFALSLLLTFLSALLIRPRIGRVRARRKIAKELSA